MYSENPAWKWLISPTLATHECIPLITTIFLDNDQVKVVMQLSGDDAQTFINMIDEVSPDTISHSKDRLIDFNSNLHFFDQALDGLPSEVHGSCLRYLHRICGNKALLPRSLEIPLCYNPKGNPVWHNGLADIWKGQYKGQQVTAEVLKPGLRDDPRQIRRVGRWWSSQLAICINNHPHLIEVLQGGCGMEGPSPSKRAAAVGRDNDRDSVCDGIGVDGKR